MKGKNIQLENDLDDDAREPRVPRFSGVEVFLIDRSDNRSFERSLN